MKIIEGEQRDRIWRVLICLSFGEIQEGADEGIGIYCRVLTEKFAQRGYNKQDQIRESRKMAGMDDSIEYRDDAVSGEFLGCMHGTDQSMGGRMEKASSRRWCIWIRTVSRKLMNQLKRD